jgi:hypothetical protein
MARVRGPMRPAAWLGAHLDPIVIAERRPDWLRGQPPAVGRSGGTAWAAHR